jgi:hypothetical protein
MADQLGIQYWHLQHLTVVSALFLSDDVHMIIVLRGVS